jgi:ABC-type antimicrobial peptide transport system permease subunit
MSSCSIACGSAPGVKTAALAAVPILAGDEWDSSMAVEGHRAADGEDVQAFMNALSPDYVAAQLYGIHAHDPFIASSTVLLSTIVSAAAGLIPAQRAGRIDPMLALRQE